MKRLIGVLIAVTMAVSAGFEAVDADRLVQMRDKGVPVIDIRTPGEWESRGVIEGAKLMMFFDSRGKAHPQEWLQKLRQIVKSEKDPFIIYCAHANRSKTVGRWLSQKMGYEKVYELAGGIEYGWIDKGKKVQRLKK